MRKGKEIETPRLPARHRQKEEEGKRDFSRAGGTMIILIVLAFLAIAGLDGPDLWRRKKWRELAVTGTVWSLGLALSLALAWQVPIPLPRQILERAFGPVTMFLNRLLTGS